MVLNTTSYAHKMIRALCFELEQKTGMKLITNLSAEFDQVTFKGKLSYIVIDYQKSGCYTLSHRITREEMNIIKDLMLELDWLETGHRVQKQAYENKLAYERSLKKNGKE